MGKTTAVKTKYFEHVIKAEIYEDETGCTVSMTGHESKKCDTLRQAKFIAYELIEAAIDKLRT